MRLLQGMLSAELDGNLASFEFVSTRGIHRCFFCQSSAVLSVWGGLNLFSVILSEDEPLTPNIDGVMAL